MKKLCWVLSLPLLFSVFFSCSDKETEVENRDNGMSSNSSFVKNTDASSITGLWKLFYLDNNLIDATYRIQFSDDNTYRGVTKCFGMNEGTYTTEQGPNYPADMVRAWALEPMMRYKMTASDVEQKFAYAYYHTTGFRVDEDGNLNQMGIYNNDLIGRPNNNDIRDSLHRSMVVYKRVPNSTNTQDIKGRWTVKSVMGEEVDFGFELNITQYNAEVRISGYLRPNRFACGFYISSQPENPATRSLSINYLNITPENFFGTVCDQEEERYLEILDQATGFMINGPLLFLFNQESIIATFMSMATQADIQEFNAAVESKK